MILAVTAVAVSSFQNIPNLCFFGSSSIPIHCTVAVALNTASTYAVGTQLDKLVVVSTHLVILAVTVLRVLLSRIN